MYFHRCHECLFLNGFTFRKLISSSVYTLMLLLLTSSQDIVSEHPERFFVAEIVREKIFMQFRNEVPYACQVYDKASHNFPVLSVSSIRTPQILLLADV